MSFVETGQMSVVETGQMIAAETSVLSQQKTSILAQCCPRLLLPAAGCSRLTQADPDHEIQDVDIVLLEKLKVVCSITFSCNFTKSFEGDI